MQDAGNKATASCARNSEWGLGEGQFFVTLCSIRLDSSVGRPDEGQLIPKGCGWSRFLSQRTQAGAMKTLSGRWGVPSVSYVQLMDEYYGDCSLVALLVNLKLIHKLARKLSEKASSLEIQHLVRGQDTLELQAVRMARKKVGWHDWDSKWVKLAYDKLTKPLWMIMKSYILDHISLYTYVYVYNSVSPFILALDHWPWFFVVQISIGRALPRPKTCCLRVPGRNLKAAKGCSRRRRKFPPGEKVPLTPTAPGSSLPRFREVFCMAPFEKLKLLVTLVAVWQSTNTLFCSVTIGGVSIQKADEVSKSRTHPTKRSNRWNLGVLVSPQCGFQYFQPLETVATRKLTWQWKKTKSIEDVFPIKNGDFPAIAMLVCWRVHFLISSPAKLHRKIPIFSFPNKTAQHFPRGLTPGSKIWIFSKQRCCYGFRSVIRLKTCIGGLGTRIVAMLFVGHLNEIWYYVENGERTLWLGASKFRWAVEIPIQPRGICPL